MNVFGKPVEAPKPKAVVPKGTSIVLIRAKSLGNNCGFIANAWKAITGKEMAILTPEDVKNGSFGKPEWAIRWGTTTPTGDGEVKVLNRASAIKKTIDKAGFRKLAATKKLTPLYWDTYEQLQNYSGDLHSVIVRAREHSRSEDLYHCTTPAQVEAAIKKLGTKGYYISEYIPKDKEIRVFVVQGRAVMVFDKQPKNKNDISWGCVEEGALKYVAWSEWNMEAVRVAIESFNLSTLDFGAVDVIIKGDKAYMLEINTAPEVWPYYGERLAEAFKYIIEKGRDRLPVKNYKDWRNAIHPSCTPHAVI